jgi:hypothetical protein
MSSSNNLYYIYDETSNVDDLNPKGLADCSLDDVPLDLPLLAESSENDDDGPPELAESSDDDEPDHVLRLAEWAFRRLVNAKRLVELSTTIARRENSDHKLEEQVDVVNGYIHVPINIPPVVLDLTECPDLTSDLDIVPDDRQDDPTLTSTFSTHKSSLFGKGYSRVNEGDGPGDEQSTPPSSSSSPAPDLGLYPDDLTSRSVHPGLHRGQFLLSIIHAFTTRCPFYDNL